MYREDHKEDGENLGSWLYTQKQKKKRGKLDQERFIRLTKLGIDW